MYIRSEVPGRHPVNWTLVSARVRQRSQGQCERCRAPNRELVYRFSLPSGACYQRSCGRVFDADHGRDLGLMRHTDLPSGRFVKVRLAICRTEHIDLSICGEVDLANWCQRCCQVFGWQIRHTGPIERRRELMAQRDLFARLSQ